MDNEFLQQAIKDGQERISVSDARLLLKACDISEAKTLLEIGSMCGGSTIILGSYANEREGMLYCIEPHPTKVLRDNLRKYELLPIIKLLNAMSPWVSTNLIPKIDFLFIDGDHRTTSVITDFIYFFPFIKSGGAVAFHDWRESYQSRNPVNDDIRMAIEIILKDYGDKLERIPGCKCEDLSTIAFRKK